MELRIAPALYKLKRISSEKKQIQAMEYLEGELIFLNKKLYSKVSFSINEAIIDYKKEKLIEEKKQFEAEKARLEKELEILKKEN